MRTTCVVTAWLSLIPGSPSARAADRLNLLLITVLVDLMKDAGYLTAIRHKLYQHRVVEELYHVADDPDCLVNLMDAPAPPPELAKLRKALEAWMVETGDHMLDVFRQRGDPVVREAYVQQKEKECHGQGGREPEPPGRPEGRSDLDFDCSPSRFHTPSLLAATTRKT